MAIRTHFLLVRSDCYLARVSLRRLWEKLKTGSWIVPIAALRCYLTCVRKSTAETKDWVKPRLDLAALIDCCCASKISSTRDVIAFRVQGGTLANFSSFALSIESDML